MTSEVRTSKNWQLITLGLFIAEVLIATIFSGNQFIRACLGDYLVVILLYCLVKSFCNYSALRWDALS